MGRTSNQKSSGGQRKIPEGENGKNRVIDFPPAVNSAGDRVCLGCEVLKPVGFFSSPEATLCRSCELAKAMQRVRTKPCAWCGQIKPLDEYALHSRTRDQHTHTCNECLSKKTKKHQVTGMDRKAAGEHLLAVMQSKPYEANIRRCLAMILFEMNVEEGIRRLESPYLAALSAWLPTWGEIVKDELRRRERNG